LAVKFGAEGLDKPVPILEKIRCRGCSFRLTFLSLACLVVAGFVTFKYYGRQSSQKWIYNNVIAISFSIYFLNKLLVTNYRNAVIYLLGMMVYDAFWVFGSDVMVTVASQFDCPIKLLIPQDPNSLQVRFSILGIGDIALPGIF